jgi:flagellar hook-associated protein 1 FlgK
MDKTSDYAQTYGQLVSRVGSKTHELEVNRKAQQLLLDQAIAAREETSGVNLDEEAAEMVKFQNLYQANAQVIAAMNQTFQILMDAFRR